MSGVTSQVLVFTNCRYNSKLLVHELLVSVISQVGDFSQRDQPGWWYLSTWSARLVIFVNVISQVGDFSQRDQPIFSLYIRSIWSVSI